jgi:integrase
MPYQMPSGKWRGKRMIYGVVKTKSFTTKAAAKKWEADQSQESWIEQETPIDTGYSVTEWINSYLDFAVPRFVKKTNAEKKDAFKALFAVVAKTTPAEEITPGVALNVLRKVAATRTGYAANKARKNLGAAWSWGVKYLGMPVLNPFLQVEKFPADQHKRYVPPESDFDKVVEVAGVQDKVFLLACLHTAARRGELLRLTWQDIDFPSQRVRLGTRKRAGGGMEYDWIPLTDDLCAALHTLRRINSSFTVVFPSQRGGNQCKERSRFMRLLCEKAGVKHFSLHAIRHLSASMLARANVSIPIIQAILRHKNPNTTARYLRALGSIPDVVNDVFSKKQGASKVISFEAPNKAVGT